MSPALAGGFPTTNTTWEAPLKTEVTITSQVTKRGALLSRTVCTLSPPNMQKPRAADAVTCLKNRYDRTAI